MLASVYEVELNSPKEKFDELATRLIDEVALRPSSFIPGLRLGKETMQHLLSGPDNRERINLRVEECSDLDRPGMRECLT
jgi:hypothetical protein